MYLKLFLLLTSLSVINCVDPVKAVEGIRVIKDVYKIGEELAGLNDRTFRLRNDMQHNVVVQCSEKGNSHERVALEPGAYYTVNFRPHVRTLWWCDVTPWTETDVETHFDVHEGHEKSHTYSLKDGGIEKMELDGASFRFFKKWSGQEE